MSRVKGGIVTRKRHKKILIVDDFVDTGSTLAECKKDLLHSINPKLEIKGLAMFYNPTAHTIKQSIKIPLYYTGIIGRVTLSEKDEKTQIFNLDEKFQIHPEIEIPPKYFTWFVFRQFHKKI